MNPRTKAILQSSMVPTLVIVGATFALATSRTASEIVLLWMRKIGMRGEVSFDRPDDLPTHIEVFAAAISDPARSDRERIGAAEIVRLEAVLPAASEAPQFADRILTEFTALLDRVPDAHSARMCAIDAARAVAVGSAGEGVYAANALDLCLEAAMAIEPDNGIYPLFAAESALRSGRVEEAIFLLDRAAEAPTVDPYLRERRELALDVLAEHGLLRVSADDHLTRVAYARPSNGPGDALQSIAHELGRSLVDGRESSAREWSKLYAAIQRIGVRIASRTLLVDDAHDALMAADGFLAELDPMLIGGSNRGDSARRRAAEAALREAGFGDRLIALRRDSAAAEEFIQSALRQSSESSATLQRTARADLLIHAQSLLPLWIFLLAAISSAALVVGWRRDAADKRFPPDPVLRMFAFVIPGLLLVVWVGEGWPPFDGSRGIEGLLFALARPTPALVLVPLVIALVYSVRIVVEARLLREPWRCVARVRARSLGAVALLALQIVLVVSAVMARSTDGVVQWREKSLDALRVEHYAAQVERMLSTV